MIKKFFKVLSILFKVLSILFVVPWVCIACYWLIFESAAWVARGGFCEESSLQTIATDFIGKYGNEYAAYPLISYLIDLPDPGGEFNTVKNILRLYRRYPRSRKAYLAAITYGILDKETKHLNRILLISIIEEITNYSFGYYMVIYEMPPPVDRIMPIKDNSFEIKRGMKNIREWWEVCNSVKLAKSCYAPKVNSMRKKKNNSEPRKSQVSPLY